jgi:cellulose synthase/poly-beta-1,6-N-acetylglucosamine synthase-like glycosyltransferase/sporulation protein YlmC with PRC-barrel domain
MTIMQNVRLAVVAILGFLARLRLLPTDYLLAAHFIPMDVLSPTAIPINAVPVNEIYVTDMPELPSLSILIPVVNEDEHLVKRAIQSVRAARYKGLIKIFLLDDSPDRRYRSLAREMDVKYIARPKKIHGKAGNLNYALKNYVDTELFFVVDCDYEIIDPEIFVKMVSVMDEKTALVQAPQRYRNYYDSRASEFAEIENKIWFDTINLHCDRYSIVPYHGTNSVVRMEALREVGFLEEEAAVDDFPTYARMLLRGWKTAYIPDVVMEGYAPKDFSGLLKQRRKWAMGMGKAFVSVGYKLLGRSGFIQSIHHWCNFTWFSWPLTNFLYSILLGVFVVLEYLHIFTIPMIDILVLINLIASLSLIYLLGGRKYWRRYFQMLSMDYLLTYEFGFNYIKGMMGARTDVLTPKKKDNITTLQLAKIVVPIFLTSTFFSAITILAILIQHPFYASFSVFNAAMYAYSLSNIIRKESETRFANPILDYYNRFHRRAQIVGRKVIDKDGRKIGLVGDIAFDKNGNLVLVIALPPKEKKAQEGFILFNKVTGIDEVILIESVNALEVKSAPKTICPNCGSVNPMGSEFCFKCESPIKIKPRVKIFCFEA